MAVTLKGLMVDPASIIPIGHNPGTQLSPDHAVRLRRLGLEVMGPPSPSNWQNYL